MAELGRLSQELDRISRGLFTARGPARTAGVFPAVNVSEDSDNIYVRAELPGVAPDQLDISVEGETLSLRGERKPTDMGKEISVHRRERDFGFFRRQVNLPTRIAPDAVAAKLTNGVLEVTLPKAAEVKPRQINVQAV
jgi:HSP20 family protein